MRPQNTNKNKNKIEGGGVHISTRALCRGANACGDVPCTALSLPGDGDGPDFRRTRDSVRSRRATPRQPMRRRRPAVAARTYRKSRDPLILRPTAGGEKMPPPSPSSHFSRYVRRRDVWSAARPACDPATRRREASCRALPQGDRAFGPRAVSMSYAERIFRPRGGMGFRDRTFSAHPSAALRRKRRRLSR